MTIAWWQLIDREAESAAARSLVPDGGLLVLQGDDDAGREHAARVVAHSLESLGVPALFAADQGHASPLRSSLVAIRRQLTEQLDDAAVLPGWLAEARVSAGVLVRRVIENLPEAGLTAIVLGDVDAHSPLREAELFSLLELARSAAVVVTSHEGSGTRWHTIPGAVVRPLGKFKAADIRKCVLNSADLADRTASDLQSRVEQVLSVLGQRNIAPVDAYLMLRAIG